LVDFLERCNERAESIANRSPNHQSQITNTITKSQIVQSLNTTVRFILIDEIVQMVPGRIIHGTKTLRSSEELFRDHFPGFGVVPGVLLVEMMAQAAGKCLDAEDRTRGKAMLVQIRKASFRDWVRPDQRAEIHAEIVTNTPAAASASCRIIVEGRDVATADLLFAFLPYSALAEDYRDEVLERYLAAQPRRHAERSG
jgi:3-hydroxyacyl-[acyl-carrier-protein] dehydratase